MHFKVSSAKFWPYCLRLNVLNSQETSRSLPMRECDGVSIVSSNSNLFFAPIILSNSDLIFIWINQYHIMRYWPTFWPGWWGLTVNSLIINIEIICHGLFNYHWNATKKYKMCIILWWSFQVLGEGKNISLGYELWGGVGDWSRLFEINKSYKPDLQIQNTNLLKLNWWLGSRLTLSHQDIPGSIIDRSQNRKSKQIELNRERRKMDEKGGKSKSKARLSPVFELNLFILSLA